MVYNMVSSFGVQFQWDTPCKCCKMYVLKLSDTDFLFVIEILIYLGFSFLMEWELQDIRCGKSPFSHMSGNEFKRMSWKKDAAPKPAWLIVIHTSFTTNYLYNVFIFIIPSRYICN
jgi:hypothetical protein